MSPESEETYSQFIIRLKRIGECLKLTQEQLVQKLITTLPAEIRLRFLDKKVSSLKEAQALISYFEIEAGLTIPTVQPRRKISSAHLASNTPYEPHAFHLHEQRSIPGTQGNNYPRDFETGSISADNDPQNRRQYFQRGQPRRSPNWQNNPQYNYPRNDRDQTRARIDLSGRNYGESYTRSSSQSRFPSPRPGQRSFDPPPQRRNRCFKCGSEDHFIRNCALNKIPTYEEQGDDIIRALQSHVSGQRNVRHDSRGQRDRGPSNPPRRNNSHFLD